MNERGPLLRSEELRKTSLLEAEAAASDLDVRIGFPSSEERQQTLEWLGEGLRPGRPGRLAMEYPLVFERGSGALPITLADASGPRAFCVLWPVHLRVGASRLALGLVSLVYTDPRVRGRGYASRVVGTALDRAEELGLGLVVLWSELEGLYRRLGFDRSGAESLLLLDPGIVAGASRRLGDKERLTITPATATDWVEIERLRDDRETQLEMDRGGLGRFARVPDLAIRVARRDGRVVGFAMRGRGDDLQEVIHEWGGEPAAVLDCCASHLEDRAPDRDIFLLADRAARQPLPWALRAAGARRFRQPLAWMRIASARALARDLGSALASPVEISARGPSARSADRRFEIGADRGRIECSQQTLLDAFLGAADTGRASEARGLLEPALGSPLLQRLPLPFFLWGLESI